MATPPVTLTSFDLPSHSILTVGTGTTYTPELHRDHVHTRLRLRFECAYPMSVREVREQNECRGFDFTVTGLDELEQLIHGLERAAAQLREQANMPKE